MGGGAKRLVGSASVGTLVSFSGIARCEGDLKCCRVMASRLAVRPLAVVRGCRNLARVRSRFHVVGDSLRAEPLRIEARRRVTTRLLVYVLTLVVLHVVRGNVLGSKRVAVGPGTC